MLHSSGRRTDLHTGWENERGWTIKYALRLSELKLQADLLVLKFDSSKEETVEFSPGIHKRCPHCRDTQTGSGRPWQREWKIL